MNEAKLSEIISNFIKELIKLADEDSIERDDMIREAAEILLEISVSYCFKDYKANVNKDDEQ